jgi:hypothetical protein
MELKKLALGALVLPVSTPVLAPKQKSRLKGGKL